MGEGLEHNQISVPNDKIKHLARNVPTDFSAYCEMLRNKYFPRGEAGHGRNDSVLERRQGQILRVCFTQSEVDRAMKQKLAAELFDTAIRYEALKLSVDMEVSPRLAYEKLNSLKRNLERALEHLEDKTRDRIALEMAGLDRIQDLPLTQNAFDSATSLAEKVTIARQVVSVAHSQIAHMANHFDYKRGLLQRGKPATYSFAYAIFSLAELFEKFDQQKRSAVVLEKISSQDAHWSENYVYEGPFLDFVAAFFQVHDPQQVDQRVGSGFASIIRKVAQRRKKAPELHRLLHGDAKAQQVIDFMVGLDALQSGS